MIPKEVTECLDALEHQAVGEPGISSVRKVSIKQWATMVRNFMKTTDRYVRQLEMDYDEMEIKNVRGSYGGTD